MATIRKKGDYQWHVQIRRKKRGLGEVKATQTFTTKADAEEWAREIEREIDRGVYVSRAEAESTTLTEACDRYEKEILPGLKGKAADSSRLKTIKKELGKSPLSAINSTTLAKFRDARSKIVSSQSVIHELGLINRVLKTCVLDWGIALPGGIPQVRKPAKPRGRDRRVEQGEVDEIISASESQELGVIVGVAIETAMRRGEIATLERDSVNLKSSIIQLTETKNGDSRKVPMSPKANELLSGIPARLDGKVFGMQPDSISQAFDRAVRRARNLYVERCKEEGKTPAKGWLVDLHFHDLRHEATSRLSEEVSNIIELATITGHRDLQMLKRYYHPKVEDLVKKLKRHAE